MAAEAQWMGTRLYWSSDIQLWTVTLRKCNSGCCFSRATGGGSDLFISQHPPVFSVFRIQETCRICDVGLQGGMCVSAVMRAVCVHTDYQNAVSTAVWSPLVLPQCSPERVLLNPIKQKKWHKIKVRTSSQLSNRWLPHLSCCPTSGSNIFHQCGLGEQSKVNWSDDPKCINSSHLSFHQDENKCPK